MQEERRSPDHRLTDDEVLVLRQMIESEKNMKWLWSTLRNWSVWIVAIITGATVGYNALVDVVKNLAGK